MTAPRTFDLSDKLKIINEALINTGNNQVAVVDDGSPEWEAAASAWDQRLPEVLHFYDWNFATRVQAMNRLGDSDHPDFTDVYAKPSDCLFLKDVYRPDVAALIPKAPGGAWFEVYPDQYDPRYPQLTYRIIGDDVHANAPTGASAYYVPFPVGAQPWSPGFVAGLRLKIEANLYRALNEDLQAAAKLEMEAERMLRFAVSRCNQEEPRRVGLRSGLVEARKFRRG